MINKALRVEARSKGIRLTVDRNGKRVQKREPVLRKEIRDHENGIIRTRARQTKDMLYMCKSVLSILNKNKNKNKVNSPPRVSTPITAPPRVSTPIALLRRRRPL